MSALLQRMDLRPLRWHPSPRPALRWRTELMWFLCAYLVYWTARWVFVGDTGTAQANAAWIWDLETAAGIAIELSVQRAFDFDAANTVLSNLYLAAQMAVLPVAIVWLYRRSQPIYRRIRTTIIATWLLSVPIVAAFPVAPPRLANLGFADTVSDQAAVALTGNSTAFYNAFAAVPSLHVGFAFALGIAGVAALRNPWAKLLAASWGPIVTLTVIATGNHYVLDAITGIAITAVGYAVCALHGRSVSDGGGGGRGEGRRRSFSLQSLQQHFERCTEQNHVVKAVIEPALVLHGAGHDDIAMVGRELCQPWFVPSTVRERPSALVDVDHDLATVLQFAEHGRLPGVTCRSQERAPRSRP